MNIKHTFYLFTICTVSFLVSCIFAPAEGERKTGTTTSKWQEPITPGIVIENLTVAFNDRDIDLYEHCLHPDYFYESPSTLDSLNVDSWSRSYDVLVMERLFDECSAFIFIPNTPTLVKEYGSNIDNIPDGVTISDKHPDAIWYIYNYDITMDMIFKDLGDYKVQQYMKFAMIEDPPNYWSIIRWIDDSLVTE